MVGAILFRINRSYTCTCDWGSDVGHALRLLCIRSVDVMTSSHLFFSSIILSTSLVPTSMVLSPNGLLDCCFLYAL